MRATSECHPPHKPLVTERKRATRCIGCAKLKQVQACLLAGNERENRPPCRS